MPPVSELVFKRATINLADAARLGEGEDLNDALLDFFVRVGQTLLPKGSSGEAVEPPVAYLGSLFWKQLTSAFATSGEEGWKQVSGWAKRKAGGLYQPNYGALAVPINEDLKDDKGADAGNHWWLALVLNPPGGARGEPMAVMCLDSMQRRDKVYSPPLRAAMKQSRQYTVDVSKIEQAGYLISISFAAKGDGTLGGLPRPEGSSLLTADGYEFSNPSLGLRINMPGQEGFGGRFEGTLTFELDGRCRSSVFTLRYGEARSFTPLKLEFDAFELTKLQKTVSRFIGGYLAKEWETNGPMKKVKFEKTSARALVADVYQQENLNDCGVFVLENMLRSITMQTPFLKKMAEASSEVLKSYPWPTQKDITSRKQKLKAATARLFAAAAQKGTADVEKLIKDDEELRIALTASLTDERTLEAKADLDKWSGQLQAELAARTVDKEQIETEKKQKEEALQEKRLAERMKKEEEERRIQEDRLKGKGPQEIRAKRPHVSTSDSESKSSSSDESGKKRRKKSSKDKDRGKSKGKDEKKGKKDNGKSKKESAPPPKNRSRSGRSRKDSRSESPPARSSSCSSSGDKRKAKKAPAKGKSKR
mmetsp:Transcript_8872/g.19871  ORF Transcript_8872/g.19871 Transcript_8872/m.19871 type:complete len:592 (+) Transcript_8872:86-1861(+)